MRKLVLMAAVLALTAAACGGGDDGGAVTPPPAGGSSVNVDDNVFNPASLTVTAGSTVTWTWVGAEPHTVTGTGFDSGIQNKGFTFNQTFATAGTVDYTCNVHPEMTGKIVVT